LNNAERPPAYDAAGKELYAAGRCRTSTRWTSARAGCSDHEPRADAMHLDPATTLHDVRWGEHYKGNGVDDFVWVFQISGAVPPSHIAADTPRRAANGSAMYFRWRRHAEGRVQAGRRGVEQNLHQRRQTARDMDGDGDRAAAEETERRLKSVTPQWPIMHVCCTRLRGPVHARHPANHVNVA